MKPLILIVSIVVLVGCARSSGLRVSSGWEHPPHSEPVCFLKSPLPSSIKHREIAMIYSDKQWYGSVNELLPLMAKDVRAAGGDAIVNLVTAHRVGLFAWARPTASGMAVKVENRADLNCAALGGQLY